MHRLPSTTSPPKSVQIKLLKPQIFYALGMSNAVLEYD